VIFPVLIFPLSKVQGRTWKNSYFISFLGGFPKKIKEMFKKNAWKNKEIYRRKILWKSANKKTARKLTTIFFFFQTSIFPTTTKKGLKT
jgi:hypothetical protein